MKHLYYLSFIALFWLFCLSSCGEPCNAERVPPVLFLLFTDATTNDTINPPYNQVYLLDNHNNSITQPTFDSIQNRYTLPLSTLEDQVTYVFEKTNQSNDTLVITYKRTMVTNPKCGSGVSIENVEVSSQSTFTIDQTRIDVNRFLFIDL